MTSRRLATKARMQDVIGRHGPALHAVGGSLGACNGSGQAKAIINKLEGKSDE